MRKQSKASSSTSWPAMSPRVIGAATIPLTGNTHLQAEPDVAAIDHVRSPIVDADRHLQPARALRRRGTWLEVGLRRRPNERRIRATYALGLGVRRNTAVVGTASGAAL